MLQKIDWWIYFFLTRDAEVKCRLQDLEDKADKAASPDQLSSQLKYSEVSARVTYADWRGNKFADLSTAEYTWREMIIFRHCTTNWDSKMVMISSTQISRTRRPSARTNCWPQVQNSTRSSKYWLPRRLSWILVNCLQFKTSSVKNLLNGPR